MSVVTTRVPVATTATQLNLTAAWNSRRSRVLYNNGPNTIWIGGDNGVTAANGFPVPAGAALAIDHDPADEIWAICSVLQVSPADTCILSESQS